MKTSFLNCHPKLSLVLAVLTGLALGTSSIRAAQNPIYKLNTATMSAAADWSATSGGSAYGSGHPVAGDIGTFDSTFTGGTLNLGGNTTNDALVFNNTAATTIGYTASATLTLGAATGTSGIDMSAATQNVGIYDAVKFNQNLTITNASGRTLTFGYPGTYGSTVYTMGVGTTTTYAGADNTATLIFTNVTGSSGIFTAGALWKIISGQMWMADGRGFKANLEIDGGSLNFSNTASRLSLSGADGQTFTMTGGSLTVPSTTASGLRLGDDTGGANNTSFSFTGTQSGGTVTVNKGSALNSFCLGGTSASKTASYTLSGSGVLNVFGGGTDGTLELGADTAGTSTTTFNLQGGTLQVSGNTAATGILGSQGASAKQVFYWTGGTLACGAYNASALQNTAGGAYGVLTNYGGTLAPGNIGTAGKTIINGSYVATSASVLDIDINGSSPAATYQTNTVNLGYDVVAVTNTAYLAGSLVVRTNGAAIGAGPFTVLTTVAGGLSGTFGNLYNGRVTIANANGASFAVTIGTASLQLGSWAALTAAWTVGNASAPAGSTVTFTDNGSVGAITNWIVDYGDGSPKYTNSTSVGASTTHIYTGGTYTATLTVVASDGSTAITTQAINASSNPTLAWLGTASAFWNTSDLNWTNLSSGGTGTVYGDGDPVVFNESGSAHSTVNLNSSVIPASVAFSNSVTTYTLQGTGKITSTASLTKSLAGTAIILTTNDYTGGTTINGGTLQLGDGATATGTLGSGTIANNGSLVLNPAGAASVTNVINGSGTVAVKNSAVTLTAANGYNGGTTVSNAATAVISADNNLGGSGSGLTLNNGTVQVTTGAAFTLSHPLTINSGGGTLNLANTLTTTNANSGSGTLTVSAGTLQIGAAGTAGSVAGNISLTGGSLAYSRTDTITPSGSITGNSVGSSITNASTAGGSTNTLTLADGINTFGNILNTSAGQLNLTGTANSTNILGGSGGLSYSGNASLAVSGGTFIVTNANMVGSSASSSTGTLIINGGTVNSSYNNGNNGGSRHFKGNLTINSGTFHVTTDRMSMDDSSGSQALTLNGGNLLFDSSSGGGNYGFRFGNDGGTPGQAGYNFTGVQTNGLLLCSNAPITMGGVTASKTTSYTLSGGTASVVGGGAGLTLISDTNGTGSTSFILTNTAKLTVLGTISGNNPNTTSVQVFSFQGGTLAANAIDMTYLRDTAADPVGTFVNAGGTLLPGDVGYPGQFTVTGNFSNAPTATLGIEIAGTTAADVGQETVNTNRYDNVLVKGAAVLAGNLNLTLANGYEPNVWQHLVFTIMTATNGVTGTFANTNGSGRVTLVGDPTRSFAISIVNSTNVELSSYQTPTPQAYFTQDTNAGAAPLTVTFTNLSNGSGLTNLWSFGDGGTTTSTAATVSHTYSSAGTNIVSLTVGNTLGVSTYTVSNAVMVTNAIITASSDASLGNLVVQASVSPTFVPGQTNYAATNFNANTSVTLLVTNNSALATNQLYVGGSPVGAASVGTLSNTVTGLLVGNTVIQVVVTAQDGVTTSTNTVTVTRLPSSDASLGNLVVQASVSPTFVPGQTNYAATNFNANTSVTLLVTNNSALATNQLYVGGSPVGAASVGTLSNTVTGLLVGNTVIQVVVTAQDGATTSTNTVTVTRLAAPLSTNAYLTSLVLSNNLGAVVGQTPTFMTNWFAYFATNTLPANNVNVTVTDADPSATNTLSLNGGTAVLLASGNTSSLLTLNPGSNTVAVTVTAQDGVTVQTYTVNVFDQPSQTVPKLTNSVSGNNLLLSWPADHLGYRLLVQTNNLNKGVSSNINDWGAVAGSTLTTTTNLPIIKTGVTNEYYRLVYP